MRRIYTYILALALLALGVACQRVDLPEDSPINPPAELPTGAIGSKATISFTTADLTGADTRAVVDPNIDVETLHLIVFDENGMLVEVCEAIPGSSSEHVDENGAIHKDGRHYTVTLTVTDKPRIIHYVANCPVDQVVYGHETSIIGNMYVDRTRTSGDYNTEYEVAYWARIWVPYILIEEETVNGTTVISLVDEIEPLFTHVALLRNFAEITVTDETDDTFLFEGFTVYNLLDRGTVAPYNSNRREFQHFFETTTDGTISNYSYPYISKEYNYEGHALTSAKLITDFIRKEDGKVKIYNSGEPFYVYERKVSVMTDEEEKWRESPPHIIIKGKYNNGKTATDASPSYYYKMDLVYTEKDAQGFEEIKYYNILRNFMYQFNLTAVHDVGYDTLDQAVAGAAGNNISGSSSTSKLTNVSDNDGRLWVSHTDTTLVTNDAVIFRYKYVPNYYGTQGNAYTKDAVHNELARFENIVGDVITGIEVAESDISDDGPWKDYREVTIHVKNPENIIHQQVLSLKTNSSHLNRQIRYTLRQKLSMQVECTPKVAGKILEPMTVDIKLPEGMTEDMFPLSLNMETWDRTLSPDASKNTVPVTAGPSIIESRQGALSYYYTVTIPTFDEYRALKDKVYHTYWLTNKAANASTFYVENKYFNQASDDWLNYKYTFKDVSCSTSALGVGQPVTISFKRDKDAINTPVTISLKGMTYTGTLGGVYYSDATEVIYTKSGEEVDTITGFKTTTAAEAVSFTIDAEDYNIDSATGARKTYQFDGQFVDVTNLEVEADVEVEFTFNIPDAAFTALQEKYSYARDAGVPMFVTLDRMHPADGQLVYSQARTGGDRYIYYIKQAGQQRIKLATTEAASGTCTVTLEADYFDTQTVEIYQTDVKVMFNSWVKSTNNSVTNATRNYVYPGEKVLYYVNVSADNTPSSVTIDGISATRSGTFTGSGASNTTWYVEWSKSTTGTYPMTATVVIDGQTYTQALGNMTVVKRNVTVGFNSWVDTSNNLITNDTRNYVVVGENVRYYVKISTDEEPSSVSIDNKTATQVATRSGASNTTWYVEYSNSTKGNKTISVNVSFTGDDNTYGTDLTLKVAGISLGTATTSPNTNGTEYVMQNTAYTNTYCTSANTNLSASQTLDYNSLFTIETSGNGRKIKSVAKGTYCSGSSNRGSVSFNATGTTYTFNNGYISTGNVYMRQSNNTNVTFGNNGSSNRSWRFIPVTYDIP